MDTFIKERRQLFSLILSTMIKTENSSILHIYLYIHFPEYLYY